ncbi:MAG: UDP-glucose 4-epimerase GalE [Cyanobium sp.]
MANILVTGGAGYVGCHVLLPLIEQGHHPVVYDNLIGGHRCLAQLHRGITLVEGALEDRQRLQQTLATHGVNAVLHLAAAESSGPSTGTEPSMEHLYATNGGDTLILMEELVRYRPDNPPPLVFGSSCAVFDTTHDNRIRETSAKTPATPYGRSKLVAEWVVEDVGRCRGISHVILRSCNVAGAQLQNGTGEWHDPETHLIPRALRAAREQTVLPIYGMNFPTPDGTAVRDFMHVCDLAAAHMAALNYLLAGGASTAFNLGTGMGYSVLEVVHAVERITQTKLRIQNKGRQEGDPAWRICNASKAREVLRWTPQHSSLDVIVGDAAAWDAHLHSRESTLQV